MINFARVSIAGVCLLLGASACLAEDSTATRILAETKTSGGLVVHLGCGDGQLTAGLCPNESYLVHGLDSDPRRVEQSRKRVQAAGKYGRVSIALLDGERLPYASNVVNLLVISDLGSIEMKEVDRVLVPGGTACVLTGGKRRQHVKPWPEDMGQWSHYLHGADGNPVTPDERVGPPRQFQWVAGPAWQRSHDSDSNINALVSAGGRVFYLVDEAPIGWPSMPDKWLLTARDAFNGILLWQVPVEKWGWRQHRRTVHRYRQDMTPVNEHHRLVATDRFVYMPIGTDAQVSQIDAATGKVLQTYKETDGAREILHSDGELLLSVPSDEGLALVALNAETGDLVWRSEEFAGTAKDMTKSRFRSRPVLSTAADSRSVCLLNNEKIVCLDRKTGKTRWSIEPSFKSANSSKTARGTETMRWVGTLIVQGDVALYSEPGNLVALSTADGSELWKRSTKQPSVFWHSWKNVFVIDSVVWILGDARGNASTEILGLDLKTGEVQKRVPLGSVYNVSHHHRCYRNKATSRFMITSRRGVEFLDLRNGEHVVDPWVRGTCHLGMMPANGLLYAPPEPCRCFWYERLSDFCALASEETPAMPSPPAEAVRGPAFGNATGTVAANEDWPEYRGDAARSGSTEGHIFGDLGISWQTEIGSGITPPIIVGNRAFVAATDSHAVVAANTDTGEIAWRHTADGRVNLPPTYARGKVVFGSTNGSVTCLRATDGELVWRFQTVPHQRLIGVHSQLESTWPVYGSVLVVDGVVYCSAGRSSYLDGGIHIYGLDLNTGKRLHYANVEGPHLDAMNRREWYSGYQEKGGHGALNDALLLHENTIFMRNRAFDMELKPCESPQTPRVHPMAGFLDETDFKRYSWYFAPTLTKGKWGSNPYRLVAKYADSLYGARPYGSKGHSSSPTNGHAVLKTTITDGNKPQWAVGTPIRVAAMAATRDHLAICGPPAGVDPEDPLAAFEARKGGRFLLLSTADGKTDQELELEYPPVFNGIAVANGRVFLSLKNGRLLCLKGTANSDSNAQQQ